MEGLTKTIPPSLSPSLPSPSLPHPQPSLAGVPTVSFSSTLSFIFNLRLSFATAAYFSLRVRDALGIREQSTLWVFVVRLREASLSLSKQFFCLSHSCSCANGSFVVADVTSLQGLPCHMSDSNETAWHHFNPHSFTHKWNLGQCPSAWEIDARGTLEPEFPMCQCVSFQTSSQDLVGFLEKGFNLTSLASD